MGIVYRLSFSPRSLSRKLSRPLMTPIAAEPTSAATGPDTLNLCY